MNISKKFVAYGLALALEGSVAYATSLPAGAAWDPTSLETTVAQHTSQINDLNARVTNNEQDLKTLGTTANIPLRVDSLSAAPGPDTTAAPATATVAAPADVTPAPTPAPTVTAPTITSTENGYVPLIMGDTTHANYVFTADQPTGAFMRVQRLTFSDGHTEVWGYGPETGIRTYRFN